MVKRRKKALFAKVITCFAIMACLSACGEESNDARGDRLLHLRINDQPEIQVPITNRAHEGEPCSPGANPVEQWAVDSTDGSVMFCAAEPLRASPQPQGPVIMHYSKSIP